MPDIADQYRIIARAAGWRLQAELGRLRFGGADRVSFLQALVTNDVESLRAGSGAYAAYLTPNGRMITDLHLYLREADILASVPAANVAALAARFDQLIFAEDVSVTDVSAELTQVLVAGGQASRALGMATGLATESFDALPLHGHLTSGAGHVVARADAAGELPAFTVILPAHASTDFTAKLAEAGVLAMDEALYEAVRVNAGTPEFGVDMNDTTIPLEAGLLERAISTTKGCYVGQEIVIRMLHRGGGRVAKRLMRLEGHSDAAPARGQKLSVDGREVGEITSVAPSVHKAGWVGLGYLHRDVAEAGRAVSIDGASAVAVAPV